MFRFAKNSRVDNLSRKVFAIDGYKIFNNPLKNNEFSSIAEVSNTIGFKTVSYTHLTLPTKRIV